MTPAERAMAGLEGMDPRDSVMQAAAA
jgi:hypothetical protein